MYLLLNQNVVEQHMNTSRHFIYQETAVIETSGFLTFSVCSSEIVLHSVVVGEHRGCSTNLSSHVTDSTHTCNKTIKAVPIPVIKQSKQVPTQNRNNL